VWYVAAYGEELAGAPLGRTLLGERIVLYRASSGAVAAPALLSFDVGACLTGTPESDGLCIPQAHLITPETELTSHYFFAATRNIRRDDPETGRKLFDLLGLAFREQDEPIIEAVQRSMGETGDLDSLNPILLRTDGAPVMARRTLQRLIAAEQAAAADRGPAGPPKAAHTADVG
jgi:phenylpropionate dioxygenase-like ring-hydroxylating dioxygenase large terminal subunit